MDIVDSSSSSTVYSNLLSSLGCLTGSEERVLSQKIYLSSGEGTNDDDDEEEDDRRQVILGAPVSRNGKLEAVAISSLDIKQDNNNEGNHVIITSSSSSSTSPSSNNKTKNPLVIKTEEDEDKIIPSRFLPSATCLRKRRLIGDEFYSDDNNSGEKRFLSSENPTSVKISTGILEEPLIVTSTSFVDPISSSTTAQIVINASTTTTTTTTNASPTAEDNGSKNANGSSSDVVLYDYRFCSTDRRPPLSSALYGGHSSSPKKNDGRATTTPPSDFSTSATADDLNEMATILGHAVKNEPEDLTGVRRDSSNNEDHHVVLSSADIANANFPPVTSAENSHYGGGDFGPFDASGRAVYAGGAPSESSYRNDGDLYNSASSDFVQRGSATEVQYVQYNPYKSGSNSGAQSGTTQIPSPDSGIGDTANITPSQNNESFEYPHTDILNDINNRKPWHDYGRQSEEKIHIDKIFSPYGFRYTLEAASSSSVRREDDKITYVNKGQFYGITLEYTHDPELPPLKSQTVKSVIMLVFREGKSLEEELKAWQFWHARQHSVKQRILDADTKNSVGLVGCIDEVAHNALAVYWNPMESPAKVNIAVQCLSTDFSTQKGVKGLPLHLQIDTFEDPRDSPGGPVYHRGYYQIKVFCDKGAERKARDEERRAVKRRMSSNGKRRMEEMYHSPTERSEFYSMADLSKPPVLFTPSEDPEKPSSGIEFGNELPAYFPTRSSPLPPPPPPAPSVGPNALPLSNPTSSSAAVTTTHLLNKLNVMDDLSVDHHPSSSGQSQPSSTSFKYQSSGLMKINVDTTEPTMPMLPPEKRAKLIPPLSDRIMIYVRQETEDAFTPLHLIPPTVTGLIRAVETKYKINANNIRFLYRKSKQGILAKIDDDMLRYYCNEDVFLMQVMVTEGAGGDDNMVYDITLTEC